MKKTKGKNHAVPSGQCLVSPGKRRHYQTKFKSIFDYSPIGKKIYNLRGYLLDANQASQQIFGVKNKKELKKLNLFKNIVATRELKKKIKSGKPIRFEKTIDFDKLSAKLPLKTSKRGLRHLDIQIVPLWENKQNFHTYLSQFQDITQRKLMEEVLARSHVQLELEVQKRTAQLIKTNQHLHQEIGKREKAESFLRSKNETLALMKEDLQKNYEIQRVNNLLLQLAVENNRLDKILQSTLKIILSVPWLAVESTGSIFLADEKFHFLELKAQEGLDSQLQINCARIPFGKCLCGRAAQNNRLEYAGTVTKKHTISYPGMLDHGHYCIPISLKGKVLGVLNLYIKAGHQRSEVEEKFLTAVAQSLAMIIQRQKIEEMARLNLRALKVLSACNHALIHANSEKRLLEEVCEIIVSQGGYRMAWIGFAQNDKRKSVLLQSQNGFEDGYLEAAKISWSAKTPRGRGPTGTCIRTGKICLGKNFLKDKNLLPWKDQAARRKFASSIALPLRVEGKIIGAVTIYSSEINAFNRSEQKLLNELADDLSFGLQAIRTNQARKEAELERLKIEEKLIESYKHLGSINRQLSILLELNKKSGGQNTDEIINYIVNAITNLSQASLVNFYQYDKLSASFLLLSSLDAMRKSISCRKNFCAKKIVSLLPLIHKGLRVQGSFKSKHQKIMHIKTPLKYFIFLPLTANNKLKGSLFLGFQNREYVTTQELDFLEAFALQASSVLQNLNIFR